MSFGKHVKRSKKVVRENKDTVKSSFGVLETNIYKAKIVKAYIHTAKSGAEAYKIELKTESGQIIRETEYFQSGKAKGYQLFWTDREGVDHDLPGYSKFNELLVSVLGDDLLFQGEDGENYLGDIFDLSENGEVVTKNIPIYDFSKGKEVPTKLPVIEAILGKEVLIGLHDCYIDIDAKDSEGNFIKDGKKNKPSGKSKRVNQIDKYFNVETDQTYSEYMSDTEAKFKDTWIEASNGKVYDLTQNKIAPKKGNSEGDSDDGTSSSSLEFG